MTSPGSVPNRPLPPAAAHRTRVRGGVAMTASCAAAVFLTLTVTLKTAGNRPLLLDSAIHDAAVAHRPAALVHVAIWVTVCGSSLATVPATLIASFAGAIGPAARRLRVSLMMTGILVGLLLARFAFSTAMARPRPPAGSWAASAGGYAFPSGHTTGATIAAALLIWVISERQQARKAVIGCAIAYPLLIGCSRIYLGVHWPSDVLGAWAFGIAAVSGIWLIRGSRRRGPPRGPR